MNNERWLITGSRDKPSIKVDYKGLVFKTLAGTLKSYRNQLGDDWKPDCIIHGACPDSADMFADEWAMLKGIEVERHPGSKGNFLKRNIEMLHSDVSEVFAFWDGYSYGTSFTIAQAIMSALPVTVIELKKFRPNIKKGLKEFENVKKDFSKYEQQTRDAFGGYI